MMFSLDAKQLREYPKEYQDRVLAWLEKHGLDPNFVWSFKVTRRKIIATVYKTNEAGRKYIDHRGEIAMGRAKVRLLEDPPTELDQDVL